jgi:hypothetical protein
MSRRAKSRKRSIVRSNHERVDQHEAVLRVDAEATTSTVLGHSQASGSIGFRLIDSEQRHLDVVEDQPGIRVRFVRISINWSKDGKTLLTNHCLLKILKSLFKSRTMPSDLWI